MKKQLLKSALIALAGVGLMSGSGWALTVGLSTSDGDSATINDAITTGETDIDTNLGGIFFSNYLINDWQVKVTATSEPTYSGGSLALVVSSYDISKVSNYNDSLTITITDAYSGTYTGFTSTINPSSNNFDSTIYTLQVLDSTGLTVLGTISSGVLTGDYDEALTLMYSVSGNFMIRTITTFTNSGAGSQTYDASTSPVPEPATMLLFGTGMAGLAGIVRRRK